MTFFRRQLFFTLVFMSYVTILCLFFFNLADSFMLRAADFFFFFAFNFDAGGFHERSQRMLQTEYMQGNTCVAKIWFSHEKQKTKHPT